MTEDSPSKNNLAAASDGQNFAAWASVAASQGTGASDVSTGKRTPEVPGNVFQFQSKRSKFEEEEATNPLPPPPQQQPDGPPLEFDPAIHYISTIQKRFISTGDDRETYKRFLESLHAYQKEQRGLEEVLREVCCLFADHPDLLRGFVCFLPEAVQKQAKLHLEAAAKESEARKAARKAAKAAVKLKTINAIPPIAACYALHLKSTTEGVEGGGAATTPTGFPMEVRNIECGDNNLTKRSENGDKKPPAKVLVTSLGPRDVLCGSTALALDHEGNRRFQMIVEQAALAPRPASVPKVIVVEKIRKIITQSGGRFLEDEKGGWRELEPDAVQAKIFHDLKNAVQAKIYGALNNAVPPADQWNVEKKNGPQPNTKDALQYLDQIKQVFAEDRPEVYEEFLSVIKSFQRGDIATTNVVEKITTLFRGHDNLIEGFYIFLPEDHKINMAYLEDINQEQKSATNSISLEEPQTGPAPLVAKAPRTTEGKKKKTINAKEGNEPNEQGSADQKSMGQNEGNEEAEDPEDCESSLSNNETVQEEGAIEPHANDVLLAPPHGSDFRQYAGNMKLAFLIQKECVKYHESSFGEKTTMIQDVVRHVQLQSPPGRFLKLNPSTSGWIEVNNEYAYMHVLQMFLRQSTAPAVAGPGNGGSDSGSAPGGDGGNQRGPGAGPATGRGRTGSAGNSQEGGEPHGNTGSSNSGGGYSGPSDSNEAPGMVVSGPRAILQSLGQLAASAPLSAASNPVAPESTRSATGSAQVYEMYRVTVPAGVSPGSEFLAQAGPKKVRVRCPHTSRSGQSLQITLPPEPATPHRPLEMASLAGATGPCGGGSVQMSQEAKDDNQAASDSGDAVLVTIPLGIYPGMHWTVDVGGRRFLVTCPLNAGPGMKVRIVPPAQQEEPMAAPKAQDVVQGIFRCREPELGVLSDSFMSNPNPLLEPGWQNGEAAMVRRSRFYRPELEGRQATGQDDARAARGGTLDDGVLRVTKSMRPDLAAQQDKNISAACASLQEEAVRQWWADRDLSGPEHPRPTINTNTFQTHAADTNIGSADIKFRLARNGFEGAVIEVALYNYETFYKLERGTATFEVVHATSAGIRGWAASLLPEPGSPNNAEQAPPEAKDAAVAIEIAEPKKRGQKSRGEEEEARQLQIALLESIGAHPTHPDNASFEYDDDDCGDRQFDYDDDDSSCGSEGEWSNQEAEEDDTEPLPATTLEGTNGAPVPETKSVVNDTENATTTGQNSTDIAELGEQIKKGPRTVMRSSWQFQAMMGQVKDRKGGGTQKKSDPPVATQESSPLKAAPKQTPPTAEALAPSRAQEAPGTMDDDDDDSWSQLSKSSGELSDPVLVPRNPENASAECETSSWHCVEPSSSAEAADDWSEVSGVGDSLQKAPTEHGKMGPPPREEAVPFPYPAAATVPQPVDNINAETVLPDGTIQADVAAVNGGQDGRVIMDKQGRPSQYFFEASEGLWFHRPPATEEAEPPQKKKRLGRRKPAGMPRRPRSPYNLFFAEERDRIIMEIKGKSAEDGAEVSREWEAKASEAAGSSKEGKDEDGKPKAPPRPLLPSEMKRRPHRKTHGLISFPLLAQMVGQRWKALPDDQRKRYQDLAQEDLTRQEKAMEEYYAKREQIQKDMGLPLVRRLAGPPEGAKQQPEERIIEISRFRLTSGLPESLVTRDTPSNYDACTALGVFYYELELLEVDRWVPAQFGFCVPGGLDSTDFVAAGPCCGDTRGSWGVCGFRQEVWNNGYGKPAKIGSRWQEGDVIGLAVNVNAGKIAVSVNGSDAAVVVQDETIGSNGVFPCFSFGSSKLRVNVTRNTFRYSGPSSEVWMKDPLVEYSS